MIVDPLRHVTDILAFVGIFVFAYVVARTVVWISESGAGRSSQAIAEAQQHGEAVVPAVSANDNRGTAGSDGRMAA